MSSPNTETPQGIPRWVKVFVLILVLLGLLVAVIMLGVGGNHGPGSHAPGMLTSAALLAVGRDPVHPAFRSDTMTAEVTPIDGVR